MEVLVASSGSEADLIISTVQIDIIIVDICMPDINGLELINRVLAQHSDIRFIVLSGYSDFSYVKRFKIAANPTFQTLLLRAR